MLLFQDGTGIVSKRLLLNRGATARPIRHLSELNPYDNNRLKPPGSSPVAKEKNTCTVKKGNPAVAPTESVRSLTKKARVPYPSEGQSISSRRRK